MHALSYPAGRPGRALLAAAALIGFYQPASAINIVMVYDLLNSSPPASDPGGGLLIATMAEVEQAWEAIIKDPETVTITYRYTPNTNGLANASMTQQHPNGKPKAGDIDVDTITGSPWFYHLPPDGNEHWTMQQRLYRDLSAAEKAVRFNPNDQPHDLLEVSYRGGTHPTAPPEATNGFDLYTSMLHEVGHVLGLNSTYSNPGDVEEETEAVFTGGNDFRSIFHFDAGTGQIERGHLEWNSPTTTNNPLMCGDCAETGARRLPTAQDVIVIASLAGWTSIDLPRKDFIGAVDVNFNLAGNWIGNRVPDSADEAFVRHVGLAELSADAHVDSLFIGAQSIVDTEHHSLTVDKGTTLEVDVAGGFIKPLLLVQGGGEFETADLTIGADTIFDTDGGDVEINDDVVNEGELKGHGVVQIDDALFNDGGVIGATDGNVLTLVAPSGNARFNLDGRNAEEGTVEAHSGDVVIDSELNDPFDSTVSIRAGHFVEFRDGWTLNNGGEVILDGGLTADDAGRARLVGRGTLEGTVTVDDEGSVQSPMVLSLVEVYYPAEHTFTSTARVELTDAGDRLTVFGAEIEEGAEFIGSGTLLSGQGSRLDLLDGAHVGVKLTSGGNRFDIGGSETGSVSAQRLNLLEVGTMNVDIDNLPETGDFDFIEVVDDVTVRGALTVDFGIWLPPIGTRWRIIEGASVSGVFTSVTVSGLSPFRTATVEYFPDAVEVVIGGLRAVVDITQPLPRLLETGTQFQFPQGQGERVNFVLESSNPEILRSTGQGLIAERAGLVTVRIRVEGAEGVVNFHEQEVEVTPPANPACPPYGLEAQLLDVGGRMDDHLGRSVALSGGTVVSGAAEADAPGLPDAGHAVVWVRQPGAWVQQATLVVPGSAANDRAGFSVALDGDRAVVGVPGRNGGSGVAWVFGRNAAGMWAPVSVLMPPVVQAGRRFGHAVALFGDLALVGAPGDAGNGVDAGAVYVFRRTGAGVWAGIGVLRAADTVAGDEFGSALAGGFGQVAIGAPGKALETGAVYRYEPVGGAIVEQDRLVPAAAVAGDRFGQAVAVAAGPVIAGGAPFHDPGVPDGGAVGIFAPVGAAGVWTESALVTLGGAAPGDGFGWAVAGGSCGLMASAPRRDLGLPNAGTLHRIGSSSGSWQASPALVSPDRRPGDELGASLAVDGPYLAAGALLDDDRDQDAGAVYVWRSGGGNQGDLFAGGDDAGNWLRDYVDPESDPFGGRLDADDDGDGKPRFWEYLQGGNPQVADGEGSTFGKGSMGGFQYRLRLAKRAAGRYALRMESSGDGKFWSEVAGLPAYDEPDGGPNTTGEAVFELPPSQGGAVAPQTTLTRVRVVGPAPQGVAWKQE